jgi:prepilin signal peptidase PulO-like enzyme (type II secretory pathway)
MSLRPIKIAVQYLLGAAAIAFFVGLLTFIFSFLGTIFCAALAGMMLGAFKSLRWQSVPFSFLFPAVIVAVLRVTRAELAPNQVMVLAVSAFGAFWLTYVAGAFLLAFERKNQPQSVRAVASLERSAVPAGLGEAAGSSLALKPAAGLPGTGLQPQAELSLGALEGKWLFETPTNNHAHPEKVLEFKKQKLVLRVTEPGGSVSMLAECWVKLDGRGDDRTVIFAGQGNGELDEFLVCI